MKDYRIIIYGRKSNGDWIPKSILETSDVPLQSTTKKTSQWSEAELECALIVRALIIRAKYFEESNFLLDSVTRNLLLSEVRAHHQHLQQKGVLHWSLVSCELNDEGPDNLDIHWQSVLSKDEDISYFRIGQI